MLRRRIKGVLPMLDSRESGSTNRDCRSKTGAAIIFFFNGQKTKPVANPFSGIATGFGKLCCAWLSNHLLVTPAKALPVAFWTPDATGAMTAAVIPGVVHDSINLGEL
jgi:hypothetical protein